MTKRRTTPADITAVLDGLQEIVELVRRVLVKYPYETLPPQLRPFVGWQRIGSLTVHGDDLFLTFAHPFNDKKICVPIAWLTM
ncbi:hypothetical protein [Saccharopolyspora hattusasensis]|uniref:hypothetical protein n=1 Tax=Saccharopolyspora hattusasensis TaxID=1128679 RepID=UPI003D967894